MKSHFIVSLIKSIVRIAAGVVAICCNSLVALAVGLIIAELLGVVEELVDTRR